MDIQEAKQALDKLIDKARIHLYKPIQVAEILYHHRLGEPIFLDRLETYRTYSKKWRDDICLKLLGRVSTSSARYQDNLFEANAIPPTVLMALAKENYEHQGIVEAYIYQRFAHRFSKMKTGLNYCITHSINDFKLDEFIALFWSEAGLRRSIDKIYEIIVYALFSALVDALELFIEVSYSSDKKDILVKFNEFADKVLNLSPNIPHFKTRAKMYRVGVTNAADRGLDMWANFGLAIQIKHLSLSEEVAENIVNSITSDRIVIICKDAEQKLILSLLTQLGWKARIQSIITECELIKWYEEALRGEYAATVGKNLLNILKNEIKKEFPITQKSDFDDFYCNRGYKNLYHPLWITS